MSKKKQGRVPSPCIDVCKFKRGDHCIGCSMTKAQKSAFKALDSADQQAGYVQLVQAQQAVMGGYSHWTRAYGKKCLKKGATPPVALAEDVTKAG